MICFPFYFAALMYAITGAPSSGKTSIVKELEKMGEPVMHEAATDLIVSKIKSGVHEPWKEEGFTFDIVKLHLERETPYHSREGRVFLDRGVFDGYAFAMEHHLAGTETLANLNATLNPIDLNQRYEAIFFVLPYDANAVPERTEVRREDALAASRLAFATYAIYCRHHLSSRCQGECRPRNGPTSS